MDPEPAKRRLRALPGFGPWTSALVAMSAVGDADGVPVGDLHLPSMVTWALAGEPRGTDERMLELLESFAGHRGRVIRLLKSSGIRAPRFGPKLALQHTRGRYPSDRPHRPAAPYRAACAGGWQWGHQ